MTNQPQQLVLGTGADGRPVTYDTSTGGGLFVAGVAGSGKTKMLLSMARRFSEDGGLVYAVSRDARDFDGTTSDRRAADFASTLGIIDSVIDEIVIRSQQLTNADAAHVRELPEQDRPVPALLIVDNLYEVASPLSTLDTLASLLDDIATITRISRRVGMVSVITTTTVHPQLLTEPLRANLSPVLMGKGSPIMHRLLFRDSEKARGLQSPSRWGGVIEPPDGEPIPFAVG